MNTKIYLLIALLVLNPSQAFERDRLKRRKLIAPAISILVSAALQIVGNEYQSYTLNQMIESKLESIEEKEGIYRLFMKDILKVCKFSLSARTLNAELLFRFKIHLQKLKESTNQTKYEEQSNQEIIDQFKKYYEQNKNSLTKPEKREDKESQVKLEKQAASQLKMQLNSHIIAKFSQIQREIALIAEKDSFITDTICNQNVEKEAFEQNLHQSYLKIDKLMKELEETDNAVELLRDPSERRAWWAALDKAYGKEGQDTGPKDLDNRLERGVKASMKLASMVIPLGGSGEKINKAVFDLSKAIYYANSFEEAVQIINEGLSLKSLQKVVFNIGEALFDETESSVIPDFSILKTVKKIADSRTRMIQEEKSSMTGITQAIARNKVNMSNLQLIQLSQNSIFIYRMLVKLAEIDLKIVPGRHGKEMKQVCGENLLLCSSELGFSYVRDEFADKIICPKDIFIEEKEKNGSLLEKLHFEAIRASSGKKYNFYLNYFFSFGKNGIVDVVFNSFKSKNIFLSRFIGKIKQSSNFDPKECENLEEEISIEVLYLGKQKVYIVRATDKIINGCIGVELKYCKKTRNFFGASRKTEILKKAIGNEILENIIFNTGNLEDRSGQIDIFSQISGIEDYKGIIQNWFNQERNAPESRIQANSAYSSAFLRFAKQSLLKNISKLSKTLLEEVCTIAQQPIRIFSEEDKNQMRNYTFQVYGPIVKKRVSGKGVYIGSIKHFFRLLELDRKKLKLTFLDWILISQRESAFNLPAKLEYNQTNSSELTASVAMEKVEKMESGHFVHFYSSGQEYCNTNFLVEGAKQLYSNSKIKYQKEEKHFFSNSDKHLLDLYSVIGRVKSLYFPQNSIKLRNILEKENFIFNEKKKRLNVKDRKSFGKCNFSFQFVKIKGNPGEKGLKYKFGADDSLGIPTLKVETAEKGDLAFENEFFVMVFSVAHNNDLEAERERQEVFKGISMKMAHFGYFGMVETVFEPKKSVVVQDDGYLYDSKQGELGFEVFLKPYEDNEEKEKNDQVCTLFD